MKRKQKGFSLIELLIVVAIILIIAAIAIPNLIRAKMSANEAAAVATIRTINTAEIVYSSTYNTTTVFGTLAQLSDNATPATCAAGAPAPTSAAACLIDAAIENATKTPKAGYLLQPIGLASGGFAVNNDPAVPGSSGVRHFFSDQSLVIRENGNASAGAGDSAI